MTCYNRADMGHAHRPSSDSDRLRAYLADRDVSCPACGYNLRGLDSTSCPECGATLDLRVGPADLKLGPWLAALLSIGLPLGFTVIVSGAGIVANLSVPEYGREWRPVVIFGSGAVLYAPALFALIWSRRRFCGVRRAKQIRLAGLICVLAWLLAAALIAAVWFVSG